MNRSRTYWICQIGGWLFYGGVTLGFVELFRGVSWKFFIHIALFIAVGIGGTHVLRGYIKRRDWFDLSLRQLVPRMLLAVFVLAVVTYGIMHPFGRFVLELEIYNEIEYEVGSALASIFNTGIIFLLWSVLYVGLHYFWNFRRAEVDKWKLKAQIESTKLKALELQLNPHFFFNSLNSVRALIAEDPARAQRMVTRLASLMRYTLHADEETVPLRDELRTARAYLELEAVRLEERLHYTFDVDTDALDRPVPFLLVQTLVENGIKHGIAERPEGGHLTITAHARNGKTCLRVTNSGQIDRADLAGGVGLDNARERLRLLFGEEASLTVANGESDTVTAEVVIPEAPAASPPELAHDSSPAIVEPTPHDESAHH